MSGSPPMRGATTCRSFRRWPSRAARVDVAMAEIEERLAAYRDRFRLDRKVALVLGAASGIGRASAEALAALGATVICADKDRDGVERVAADIGPPGGAECHVVDAGDAK